MKLASRDWILECDKRHVWHPYTPMAEYLTSTQPLVIGRAQGSRLYDVNGRAYLDGNASWWTALLGHCHPRLIAALERQARTLAHTSLAGITHEPAALLARELIEIAPPGLARVFYSDDGSTAVEVAMKISLQYWAQNGRPARRRFLALDGAFHGETLGATALGGVEVFRRPFAGVLIDCIHVPPAAAGYERAFLDLEQIVRRESDTLSAIVLEPMVQGAAGMRMYDARYIARARELASEHDIFLIFDEVFTGYGRTGPMWACEHASVSPDILVLAKGFSGGMLPMAATLVSERVFEGFLGSAERAFLYGHTYCGNPLGAAVAREVLNIYQDEHILEEATAKAALIRDAFDEFSTIGCVESTRSLGMIGALDLRSGGGYLDRSGWVVYAEALRRGAYLRPIGNVVYVAPALTISLSELGELLSIVGESLRAVE